MARPSSRLLFQARAGLAWGISFVQKALLTSALILPLMLGACATDGVQGPGGSTQTPPITPTAFTVGAPSAAREGAGGSDQTAPVGGPSFGVGPSPADGTAFPLRQSVLKVTNTAIAADSATLAQGATVTIVHRDTQSGALTLSVSVPALGISNTTLTLRGANGGFGVYTADLSGGRTFQLLFGHGDNVTYGYWMLLDPATTGGYDSFAAFTSGYRTPSLAALAGAHATASYAGGATGVVFLPSGTTWKAANLTGSALLNVDFGAGTVAGAFQNVTATPAAGANPASPWNNVTFAGSIAGTGFSGTATGSLPTQPGEYQLGATATGHIDGAFYGSSANEAGAVWTLSDGSGSATGAFGLSSTPAGGGDGGGIQAINSGSGSVTVTLGDGAISVNTSQPAAMAGGPTLTGLDGGAAVPATTSAAAGVVLPFDSQVIGGPGAALLGTNQPVLTLSAIDAVTGKATLKLAIAGTSYDLQDVGAGPAGDPDRAESFTTQIGGVAFGLDLRHLDYTAFGTWSYGTESAGWVSGYQTPTAAVPTTGSATYSGHTYGVVDATVGGATTQASLKGDASLNVAFASGQVTGSLTNMTVTPAGAAAAPWNDVSITATLSGATFSGTTAAASAPSGPYAAQSTAVGGVQGALYGPAAQEAGAVWDLHDGAVHAVGSLGVRKP
jgi:hypothetical protein